MSLIRVCKDQASRAPTGEDLLPVAQAQRRPLESSTGWAYPSETTLRFLFRQQRRVQKTLNLDAVMVRDEHSLVALWTGGRSPESPGLETDQRVTDSGKQVTPDQDAARS